jgi:hypothetical protein
MLAHNGVDQLACWMTVVRNAGVLRLESGLPPDSAINLFYPGATAEKKKGHAQTSMAE